MINKKPTTTQKYARLLFLIPLVPFAYSLYFLIDQYFSYQKYKDFACPPPGSMAFDLRSRGVCENFGEYLSSQGGILLSVLIVFLSITVVAILASSTLYFALQKKKVPALVSLISLLGLVVLGLIVYL